MTSHLARLRAAAFVLALTFLAAPDDAAAQTTGTIRGRVTETGSGRGLPDVQVSVSGTRLAAATNPNGEYTIALVPTGSRSVTARRIGYQPVTKQVDVEAMGVTVDFTLNVSAVNLSEVVVTG